MRARKGGRSTRGFRDAGTTTRLAGDPNGLPAAAGTGIAPISAADLPEIVAYDERSSGTDRSALLRHLWRRLPAAAFLTRQHGQVSGYVMAREGRIAAQIGPLVADDEGVALTLLAQSARAAGGRVCLDLFDHRPAMRKWLDRAGFVPVTRFIRMVHGPNDIYTRDHDVYVIAGPELG